MQGAALRESPMCVILQEKQDAAWMETTVQELPLEARLVRCFRGARIRM